MVRDTSDLRILMRNSTYTNGGRGGVGVENVYSFSRSRSLSVWTLKFGSGWLRLSQKEGVIGSKRLIQDPWTKTSSVKSYRSTKSLIPT